MTCLRNLLLILTILGASLPPAHASDETDALLDLLGAPEMIAIMREEGIAYTDDLASEMLPGGTTTSWQENVAKIYDPAAMLLLTQGGFAEALEGMNLAPMMAFFESDAGQRIVTLEMSARRAMLDPAIEEDAKQTARRMGAAGDDRYVLIQRLVEAGDLLEANVVSALNSNILFYEGLVDGGAYALSDADIISDVWSQEEETRDETEDWLFAFFLLAYDPLPQDAIAEFLEFSESEAGVTLTRAIIAAYDGMYADISYALGRAVALEMQAEEI